MILAKLRDLAHREGLLANPDYEPKPVAWIIAVGDSGALLDVIPTTGSDAVGSKQKPKAKVLDIPRRVGRTSGAVADFLVDKSEYVLGAEPDGKRDQGELEARRSLFRQSVSAALAATQSVSLGAVDAFLNSDEATGKAVDQVAKVGYKANDLFAFEHRGQFVHDLPEVQAYFSASRRVSTESEKQCLICGTKAPLVDKHPVLVIRGGTTSGVALVSFNSDAFESYGLSRNENAPICRDCADAYTTALKRLLQDRYPDPKRPGQTLPRLFLRLSPDTTTVFWTDEETSLLDLITSFFDKPQIENVEALFKSPHKGRTAGPVSNRFYCLILSGGQGRAVLRGIHTGTVAQVEDNMREYFRSIDIGADQPLPLFVLLKGLVLQGKLENLPPSLATDVFLTIVFGGGFPQTLLARAVGRCRAERKVTRERAAILRAYMIRNFKWEVSVGLDKENIQPGYRLGRLMAILERVQGTAQRNLNKTIVDRYYGAASTRPSTVFPRLLALAQHHLAKLSVGQQIFHQKQLGEVLGGLSTFPATLDLEDQGLFALGYYHQRQDFFKKSEGDPVEGDQSERGEAA